MFCHFVLLSWYICSCNGVGTIIMTYVVYRVSSSRDSRVYIGYCPTDETEPLGHFLKGALRKDDRCDVRFFECHGGDSALLQCSVVAAVDSEVEAFDARNSLRSTDPCSFSGPTNWPSGVYDRSCREHPGRFERSKTMWNARRLNTARDAYAAGLWSSTQVRGLLVGHEKAEVVADLDNLTPDQFSLKYASSLEQGT